MADRFHSAVYRQEHEERMEELKRETERVERHTRWLLLSAAVVMPLFALLSIGGAITLAVGRSQEEETVVTIGATMMWTGLGLIVAYLCFLFGLTFYFR